MTGPLPRRWTVVDLEHGWPAAEVASYWWKRTARRHIRRARANPSPTQNTRPAYSIMAADFGAYRHRRADITTALTGGPRSLAGLVARTAMTPIAVQGTLLRMAREHLVTHVIPDGTDDYPPDRGVWRYLPAHQRP